MSKGLPRSLKHANKSQASIVKLVLPINAAISSVTVSTAKGFGSVIIGDFAEGNILILGVVADLTFTGPTSADLSDTFDGDYSIGTTPISDVTISAGDEDLITGAALGAATAEVSPLQHDSLAPGAIFDNTDGSLEINLNLLIDAADQVDDKTVIITATGMLYVSYIVLGDD